MTHHDMNTSTSDYGESWSIQEGHLSTSLFDGKGAYFADIHELVGEDSSVAWAKARRIIACVNACTGMADPAKETAMLKQAGAANARLHLEAVDAAAENATLRNQLDRICTQGFDDQDTIGGEPADDYVLRQLAAMREAIREAHAALDGCLKYMLGVSVCNLDLECETMDDAHHALAKLQPFLK